MKEIKTKDSLKLAILKMTLILLICALLCGAIPSVLQINAMPENLIIAQDELKNVSMSFVKCQFENENDAVFSSKTVENNQKKLKFKLFNLIPLKSINVTVEEERQARIGGYPIGVSIKSKGVIVVDCVPVNTVVGKVTPTSDIQNGDIIVELNKKPILYSTDLTDAMNEFNPQDKMVKLKVLRNGKEINIVSYPVIEEFTGNYRLGLVVKESVEGVGTVSYVKEDGRFGCLGHAISGIDGSTVIPCHNGNAYKCKILGFKKGMRGSPGELKGTFVNATSPIGTIDTNTNFGVFGKLNKFESTELYDIAGRFSVKSGHAKIYTTIDSEPKFYDIEIIKTALQNSPCEKSMIIRVTDKELLEATGGILQGMSGSPIIQDGKIVGAVTHVLISDPTKGYAVYLDWMFEH